MEDLERDYHPVLLAHHEAPCLSLYMPTERPFPQRQQNVTRFRNLVRELELSLSQKYDKREIDPLLKPFQDLAADELFWKHPRDGLAVFRTGELFRVYRLQRPVQELAIVADSFHTKPLVRVLQSADQYHVLGLSRGAAKLFVGNRYSIDEVALPSDFPTSPDDVLAPHEGSPERTSRVHGPVGKGSTHHGLDQRQKELDAEAIRYFRAVDEAVLALYSHIKEKPLFLMALPEHQHLFRSISHNSALADEGIDVNPEAISTEQLRERSWELALPYYLARLDGIIEQFGSARAAQKGSADPADIARAANGRVATLLIEADRELPGRIDLATGAIEFGELDDPEVDDLLDDIAEQVLRSGGEVVAVPSDRMPTRSGLAAIYRH